jgi:RNA polymerase sigma-70 factor (sigma-E family)
MADPIPDGDFVEYITQRSLWLRRVAYLLCQDWHRADDLAQTAMTRLYAAWPRARQVENLDGYLRRILINSYLTEQRKPWWRRQAEELFPADLPAPDADHDAVMDLRRALAILPPRQRAAIVLRYYCDLSVEQTAAELGCSNGTVKSQTSRGLEALRRILASQPAV